MQNSSLCWSHMHLQGSREHFTQQDIVCALFIQVRSRQSRGCYKWAAVPREERDWFLPIIFCLCLVAPITQQFSLQDLEESLALAGSDISPYQRLEKLPEDRVRRRDAKQQSKHL